jgi:hypothetical protein
MLCGPGSSVGIATSYGLDGPGIESRWGERFSAPVQTGLGAHPASCTIGTGSIPRVKSGRSVTLTTHPILVPWSWKGRAIPLLPLRAVRTVQSLSACTRVHFTFTLQRVFVTVDQKEVFVGSWRQMFVMFDKGMCLMEALSSVSCTSVRIGTINVHLIFFIKPTNAHTVYTIV